MLEYPVYPALLVRLSHPVRRVGQVISENVSGGDNQQETALLRCELDAVWVVGFVDGEGCFSVSVHRSPYVRRTRGWQLLPVFQVYQHVQHVDVLEALVDFFGCGIVRSKGPRSNVMTFSIGGLRVLEQVVIPFFESHPLRVKGDDFVAFASIVRMMRAKEHLDPEGFERAARLAFGMNARGKQRGRSLEEVIAGSSETVRQAPFDLKG
jgi:hypothetical protein